MAKRAVDYRGPKPKFLAVECPNPLHKGRGKTGLANLLPNGTLPGRVLDVAQSVIFGEPAHFDAKAATPRRANTRGGGDQHSLHRTGQSHPAPEASPLASEDSRLHQQPARGPTRASLHQRPCQHLQAPSEASGARLQGLGAPLGPPKTPAVAAGLADTCWKLKELAC